MKSVAARALAISIGFGFYKGATSLAYSTAMGSVPSAVGFVSELDFMFVVNGTSALTAVVLLILLARGRLTPWSMPFLPAVAATALGFVLELSGVLSSLPAAVNVLLTGILCGYPIVVLCAAWLEVLAAQETKIAVAQLVGGLFVQRVFLSLVPFLPLSAVSVIAIAAILASAGFLMLARRWVERPSEIVGWKELGLKKDRRWTLIHSYACLFVLVGVVGILHSSVLGSSSEFIVGGVNMQLSRIVSLCATLAVAVFMVRNPNPTAIFKVCLPAMLLILSLLPFFGDMLGSLVGLVLITCYEICGMIFLLFIVEQARSLRINSYGLSIVYMGGSTLVLFIGLAIGLALGALSADYGLSLLTLLAFAAIYPLVLVLLFVVRRGKAGSTEPEDKSDQVEEGAARENRYTRCIEQYAETYGLTKRETQVLGYLARGRSAKFIAEELVISENTVWAHIKRVYFKMDVHDKQELMSLVEEGARRL